MGRPKKAETEKRVKISQRIDAELHAWASARIEDGRFKDWPHVLDSALRALKMQEEGGSKVSKK